MFVVSPARSGFRRRRTQRRGGYTLLEILIAVGILSVLGTALTVLMNDAIGIWRRAETRGRPLGVLDQMPPDSAPNEIGFNEQRLQFDGLVGQGPERVETDCDAVDLGHATAIRIAANLRGRNAKLVATAFQECIVVTPVRLGTHGER